MTDGAARSSRPVIEGLLVWLSCLMYGAIAAPLPAVNEPHYWTKARHFWQPAWCAGDFFLESVNAHTAFYATFGALTLVLPLPAAVFVGRLLASAILSWGWTRLMRGLGLSAVTVLWFFLGLQTLGTLSGEWLVGGVESKVVTYGLLFAAASFAVEHRWKLVGVLVGLAITFHPVVGLWGALAGMGAALFLRFASRKGEAPAKPFWRVAIIPMALAAVCALPGLIPAVQMITAPMEADVRYAGTYLQVYYRLGHHIDPMMFLASGWKLYGVLVVIWLIGLRWGPRSGLWTILHGITPMSLGFALIGLAAGWGPRPAAQMPYFEWRMHVLKFYPFRLADLLLPLMAAATLCAFTVGGRGWCRSGRSPGLVPDRSGASRRRSSPGHPTFIRLLVLLSLMAVTLWFAHRQEVALRHPTVDHPDFREACLWVREHMPITALVQTPHYASTFKWFAERPEYVTFKDCPQDAPGIVEWNRRLRLMTRWYQDHFEGGYSDAELRDLVRRTGITHIVADRLGPFERSPVYHNNSFRVYDLMDLQRE